MKSIFLKISVILIVIFISTFTLYSQTTSIKLPAADTSGNFRILSNSGTSIMRINGDAGFYIGGTSGSGTIPATGSGVRLMWHPSKAAFRVGNAGTVAWDDSYIGYCSFATGYNTLANGSYSTAFGYSTEASGDYSTALGNGATASGSSSIAMGYNASASGTYNIAIGYNTVSSGGTAIGNSTIASGGGLAIGRNSTASGFISTAIGGRVIADGDHAIAIGEYMKANHNGSFVIGDNSKTNYDSSSALNEMTMRFNGGYRLYTNSACTDGVYMISGDGAWRSVSDRNKKENFRPVNGEQILNKIKEMPITEWNYKGANPSVKYIGPVAQDFYTAFHLGGTDSLGISTLCMDGVNIAAIQALEKRTAELQKANEKICLLEQKTRELQKAYEKIVLMENRMERLEQILTSISESSSQKISSNK